MKKMIFIATNGTEHHAYESQAKAFQAFKAMVLKRLEKMQTESEKNVS